MPLPHSRLRCNEPYAAILTLRSSVYRRVLEGLAEPPGCRLTIAAHCDQRTRSPLLRPSQLPQPGLSIERQMPVAVLHRCSVARQVTGLSRHRATQPLVADLRKRHYPTHAEPALNPRVRGSSPWRRTRSRPLTCTHAVGKILCRSHVDVPVLERCSLADTGTLWSPLVTMIIGSAGPQGGLGARTVLDPQRRRTRPEVDKRPAPRSDPRHLRQRHLWNRTRHQPSVRTDPGRAYVSREGCKLSVGLLSCRMLVWHDLRP